jgi:hypothetical protein
MQICRRIARALGGDLTAASEGLGKGCIFTFTVPLCEPPPADAATAALLPPLLLLPPHTEEDVRSASGSLPAEALDLSQTRLPLEHPPPPLSSPALLSSSTPPPASPTMSSTDAEAAAGVVSILVAEDDALSQTVMRKVLSRLGLRYTLVGDGAAAVEAYMQGAASRL